jgi:hypothetical protein
VVAHCHRQGQPWSIRSLPGRSIRRCSLQRSCPSRKDEVGGDGNRDPQKQLSTGLVRTCSLGNRGAGEGGCCGVEISESVSPHIS